MIPDTSPYNDFALVSQSPLPGWLLAACLVVLAGSFVLAAVAYARGGRRYYALIALHAVSTLLLAALIFQPGLDLRSVSYTPGRIAIVVDDSQSMQQKDGTDRTRAEQVEQMLAERSADLDVIAQQSQLELYTLGGPGKTGAAPARPRSALVDALRGPLESNRPHRPLAAVVLVSDGADTEALGQAASASAAEQLLEPLTKYGVPVNTISVGRGQAIDLYVQEVVQDPIAFVRNTFKLEAVIGLKGSEHLSVPVTLKRDGQVIGQTVVEVRAASPGMRAIARVPFELVPDQVGEFVFSVEVPLQVGETVAENNEKQFIVKVVRDKIRALLVAGRPSWEERFLRRSLRASSNVDLISFFILRTPSDLQLVPNDELSLIPFPTNELFNTELHTFDVVILQNFDYRPYQMGYLLKNLREHVLKGGALVMLGGESSFGGGAYGQTTLADVLPVQMSDAAIDERPFTPVLTPAGEKHPVLRLSAGTMPRARVLERLPKLAGLMKVDDLAPGATALLVHPDLKTATGRPMPLIAVREVGKGRAMAVTTDSLWQWGFADKMRGETGGAYERLMGQMFRWLMRDPEVSRLRLTASRDRVKVGESVELTVRVLGVDYQPLPGAQVTLQIAEQAETGRGGDAASTDASGVSSEDGTFTFPYSVGRGGVVRAMARVPAPEEGDEVLEAGLLLYADEADLERASLAPRDDLMALVASTLGGTHQSLERVDVSRFRRTSAQAVSVDRHHELPLWNTWAALLGVLLSLSLEWTLRRRWGFV